jgi:parallel beta-helix repeat protein
MKVKLMHLIRYGFVLLSILFGETIIAGNYYVSPNGTAAWSNAVNIDSPSSIYTAMNNAVAGDVVYFRGGQYNIPYSDVSNWVGLIHPANSGRQGSPITFIAYENENPVLNVSGDYGSDDFVILFATGEHNSYIIFDGFTIQGNDGRKASGVAGFGTESSPTRGLEFRNLTINGGTNLIQSTNNREGIRLENTDGARIYNNKIYNYRQTNDWYNTAAIKMYRNTNTIIEHNEIFDNSAGIYLKSRNDYSIIRHNYVHDTAHHGIYIGMFVSADYRNSHGNKIHNNLITNVGYMGISTRTQDGAYGNDNHIYNNTIYNCKYSIWTGDGSRGKVYNNVIVPWEDSTYHPAVIAKNNWSFSLYDYNLWSNNRSFKVTKNFEVSGMTQYNSLSSFQESGVTATVGDHSVYGDPGFINRSGTMQVISDFALNSSSPGYGKGNDGKNMGANIELVGLTDGYIPNIALPSAPMLY